MRFALLFFLTLPVWGQVHFDVKTDRVLIDIDGKPFSTLYYGEEAHKPFLHPLRTASGKTVTRGFPVDPVPGDPTDHPHQRGLWIGAEHLSGMDFWENDPSYKRPNMGRIEFKDLTGAVDGKDNGTLSFVASWISKEEKVVVIERRSMIFYSQPADCRMFDVDLELEAKEPVKFEDHHDALIGIRLGPAFDENQGGMPVNAAGETGEEGVRGKRSPWVDWTAEVNGEKVGVAIFDNPSNWNYPARWHVREMGLMTANPFAQRDFDHAAADGGFTLERGKKIHFKYRILIHPADADVAGFYREYSRPEESKP